MENRELDLIEKRVRKEIRKQGWMKKGARILLIDDGSINAQLQELLLNSIKGGMPLHIEKNAVGEEGFDCVLVPETKDERNHSFLKHLFSAKPAQKTKTLSILASLSVEEVHAYAQSKGNTEEKKEQRNVNKLNRFELLEKKYPGLSSAFQKSIEEWDSLE